MRGQEGNLNLSPFVPWGQSVGGRSRGGDGAGFNKWLVQPPDLEVTVSCTPLGQRTDCILAENQHEGTRSVQWNDADFGN